MEFFYLLNLVTSVTLLFWPLWFARRYLFLPHINPFSITTFVALPVQLMRLFGGPYVLIAEGFFDIGYQYALLMSNLLTVSEAAGLVFFYRACHAVRIEKKLPLRRIRLRRSDVHLSARIFLLTFLVSFYLLASAEFGLVNWLLNPREGYQLYRTGQGHWYAIATSALCVYILLSFLSRPSAKALAKNAPVFLFLGYLLGSKMILLSIFTSLLVYLWFIGWKHLTKALLFATPVIFFLLLWNLYLALSESFDLQTVFEYFDHYKNAADYYKGILSGEIQLFYGQLTLSSFWSYAPRALWPDKPFVYGILLVNEMFYPGQAELTNTPAFGGAVEQFADFGVLGVIFFGFFSTHSILTAIFCYAIFRRPGVDLQNITLLGFVALLIQFSPMFGAFFNGPLYAMLLVVVATVISVCRTKTSRVVAHERVVVA